MKSNFKKIILGCFLASLFFACSNGEEEIIVECEESAISPINPNGDSELALLMRNLYLDADSIKRLIANGDGNISEEFINDLEKVHSAIPTDKNVKTPQFEAFNKLLIEQAKTVKENPENKIDNFNLLVQRCIDCHKSVCPGPIVRIKKLTIINPTK